MGHVYRLFQAPGGHGICWRWTDKNIRHTDMLHHWRSWGKKKIWKPKNDQKVYIQPTTNEGGISLVGKFLFYAASSLELVSQLWWHQSSKLHFNSHRPPERPPKTRLCYLHPIGYWSTYITQNRKEHNQRRWSSWPRCCNRHPQHQASQTHSEVYFIRKRTPFLYWCFKKID